MSSTRTGVAVVAALVALAVLFTWPFFGQRVFDSVKSTPIDGGCDTEPSGPSALVAFDLGTGNLAWERTVGGPWPDAVRNGETVRVHSASFERVIDLSTGQIQDCQTVGIAPLIVAPASAPAPPAEPALPGAASSDYQLTVNDLPWESNVQQIGVQVTHNDTAEVVWQDEIPGHKHWVTHHIRDGVVVVSDQTGGTSVATWPVQATLTGYDIESGDQLWQVDLQYQGGTPIEVGESTVAVATQTRVTVFDTATGATVWNADHGSPGKQGMFGSYSVDGKYDQFWVDVEANLLVGLITAEKPYRD